MLLVVVLLQRNVAVHVSADQMVAAPTCKSICCDLKCESTFPKNCSTPCCVSYITDPANCATCLTNHGCTSPPTPAPPGPGPGHADQCALLCDMYHSTAQGDGWIASCKGGWATSCKGAPTTSCCDWFGITCNTNRDVTKIALGGCNLLGKLPTNTKGQSIFALEALEEFHVENGGDAAKCTENKVSGSIYLQPQLSIATCYYFCYYNLFLCILIPVPTPPSILPPASPIGYYWCTPRRPQTRIIS
jgi:hypothetical protein